MAGKRIIAVAGATGAQGGGLVRAIQAAADSGFSARALTRNPDSPAARELAALGAEVVAADLDDPTSVRRAFEGAHGAYCVTFFWAHMSPETELRQAETLANAACDADVAHVVWSTLEDTRRWVPLADARMPTLQDRYKVPHFDAKGEANAFFRDLGVPTTFLYTSFYWNNLIHFGMGPKPGPDGRLAITMPMGDRPLPGIASEDIGGCALGVFRKGRELIGHEVGISGEHLTGRQMAETLTRVLGREIVYHDVPPETYRGFGFPGADDLGNMFQFNRDFSDDFCAARSVAFSRELNPELQTFEEWLTRNRERIPIG